ncbi:MAG: BamA/TamA family outer membrane protein [Bacteroidetes bacterium]|nr:BamA/TamA family outer membrane protein [Bacteroidota bacterium]
MNGLIRILLLFFVVGCLFACNESKYLTAGQTLYTGNKVEVKSSVPIKKKDKKKIEGELSSMLRPNLNSKFLGMRLKLWIYNIAGTPKKNKGFKHWLKTKVGEAPVLASPGLIKKNADVLQNHLENKGWFHDTVVTDTKVKDKHLTAIYNAEVGPRYVIRNVTYPNDSDALGKAIDSLWKGLGRNGRRRGRRREIDSTSRRVGKGSSRRTGFSLLKKGDYFDIDVIKAERDRIDQRLKNRGFFYFNPNDLIVDADTTVGDHQVDMHLTIKPETPQVGRNIYHIGNVIVYGNYDIRGDTSMRKAVTTPEGYRILDTTNFLKPFVLSKTLVFKPGDIYNRNDHNQSLSRLVSLGVYKFVKARFQPASDEDTNSVLNAYYYLTPGAKKSIRLEASGLTRSDNTTGTELSLSWRHRNSFREAVLFTATVYGGLEEQFGSIKDSTGKNRRISTRRAGVDLNLYFPRIISPFNLNTSSAFVPKTRINAAYDIFDRSSEYTLASARGSFGYIFKNTINTENQLTILGINYVRPTNITPEFQKGLDTNITLARSIEKQFIIGPTYNFNYNSQARQNRRINNYYFNGNVDLSNNLFGLLSGANVDKGKQRTLFGVPLAQYVRLEADFRHYLRLGEFSQLVSRVTGGVGFAYGNSSTLPFIKQFFAGGTNDIRAFRSRALGPGSFYAGNPNQVVLLPDQPGDVKLEMNVEYRAKIAGLVRGALFIDAGNIWTRAADPQRPGSQFTGHFLDDIGVGVGAGLRFDLSIVVLRVDVAAPVRYPWLTTGSKWSAHSLGDISDMVLNLAIGYPF